MREELDNKLCEKYPRLFQNRNKSMQESCMFWGFSCGDGWYKIIDSLCGQIEHHVNWKRNQRVYDLKRARAAAKGRDALIKFLAGKGGVVNAWTEERADDILENGDRAITPKVHRVVVDQVKEKFGGLRFYYHGGDDVVDGMVRMAESWAAYTCETCGESGQLRHGGWVRTLCDKHEEEYQNKFKGDEDGDV